MGMGSINISIKQEAYDFLKKIKAEHESFSDAILSFKKNQNILRFHGKLKDMDWKEKEDRMKSLRKSFRRLK